MKALLFVTGAFLAITPCVLAQEAPKPYHNVKTTLRPFQSGERLTYSISWSRVFQAGVAVMEITGQITPQGRTTYRVVSTARTVGLVKTLYPVQDTVQSVMDGDELYSLFYDMNHTRGKRKKRRTMIFDQTNNTVRLIVDGQEARFPVPPRVADPLSSLYYIRTRDDLTTVGKSLLVDVQEKGKNWTIEVQVLGREKLKTPLGEFETIKLRTYPKYEGVFQHKGEIVIWITDDARRIPLRMQSEVAVGSIVAILTEMKAGADAQ